LVLDEWTTSEGEKRSRHKVIGQVKFLPDTSTPERKEVEHPAPAA
jgi:hypothetical protein